MSKRILVTGATGFVGSALVRHLLSEGHKVSVFARGDSDFWRISDIIDDVGLAWVDLYSIKKTLLNRIVQRIDPQIIYHFAANQACSSPESADYDINTDVIGTRNLLEALSSCNYELFVNAGSSSEYGSKEKAMHEDDILEPNSYHSFAKGAQTLLCQTCAVVEHRPIITLRLSSVYGPYERSTRLIPAVINGCLNEDVLNLSSPMVGRDFIYVDDVVDVCMKTSVLSSYPGEIINIGTGVQSNIRQVVDTVFDLTNTKVPCNWNADSRSWDTNVWVLDCLKAENLLGWKYKIDLREGLRKTIEWTKNVSRSSR